MKDIRTKRQEEFTELYLDYIKSSNLSLIDQIVGTATILDLCPRFGKCRVAINILKSLKLHKVLIAYPNLAVEKSWKDEFKKMKFSPKDIKFTTHRSISKHIGDWDMVIIDECHLLSEKQMNDVWHLRRGNVDKILGLTGTLDSHTAKSLKDVTGMRTIGSYSMDQGIKDGFISDYEINVLTTPLDTKHKVKYKSSTRTEKEQFDAYGAVIEKLEKANADTFYLRLARMRLIQASRAKLEATNDLLKTLSNERVLTFCGLTKTADALSCPSYHSKSKNSKDFDNFTAGKGNHLAVVKIGDTGVTYKPLSKVVINYFDSNPENLCQKINRCMGLEYSNPGKKADIWIVSSDEQVELNWLKKALKFFDPKKINYI